MIKTMRDKDKFIMIRVSETEKADIENCAIASQKKVSQYLLELHNSNNGKCPYCGQIMEKK